MTGNLAQSRPSGIFSDDVEVNGTNHMVKIITSLTSTFVPERSIQLSDGVAVNYSIYPLPSCLLKPRQNKWNLAEKGTYITCMHSSGPFKSKQILQSCWEIYLCFSVCLSGVIPSSGCYRVGKPWRGGNEGGTVKTTLCVSMSSDTSEHLASVLYLLSSD